MDDEVETRDAPTLLLTTLPRRILAVVFAGWILWSRINGYSRPIKAWRSPEETFVTVIVFFAMFMIGFGMWRLPNKAERALILSVVAASLLPPVAMIWPSMLLSVRNAQLGLALVATVAAVVVLTRAPKLEEQVSDQPRS
jgi:Mn2+/Fe2+ NRAMP family transporter